MITRKEYYLAGMTNLSLCGLSENWFFKECGHQHWMSLANAFDLEVPDFSQAFFNNQPNNPIYAAFISVALKNAIFNLVNENDHFAIETYFNRAGQSKFYSHHKVIKNKIVIAELEMISILVSRTERGNNQTVFKLKNTTQKTKPAGNRIKNTDTYSRANEIIAISKQLKSNSAFVWNNQSIQSKTSDINFDCAKNNYHYRPCPHSDFNGADFLYFANFQRIADQAQWHFDNSAIKALEKPLWQIVNRHIAYHANINLGDTLIYKRINEFETKHKKTTRIMVFRSSDSKRIADIITEKSSCDSNRYRWSTPATTLVSSI